MSKKIKITEQDLQEIKEDFAKSLESMKISDGKISYNKTLGNTNEKATLYFTEIAYIKMLALVREFDKEVAWHGIVERSGGEQNAYIVQDILVYPQEVTGATVETDQERYQTWLYDFDDDVFNKIRMQGHSHVNMSTSPSGVDTAFYDGILNQLGDDTFYIFLIWNKKGDKTIKIYDLVLNVLFETADVTVKILEDDTGITTFLENTKEMVQNKASVIKPAEKKEESPYKNASDYGKYYGDYYSSVSDYYFGKRTRKSLYYDDWD